VKIAIVSGYFNPIHIGHLDYLEGAKAVCDKLIVIVNNDEQVDIKGSTPFMSEEDRVRIVGALKCTDKVVLSRDKDSSVIKTLKHVVIQNQANGRNTFVFCNGGDRADSNTPEEEFCSNNSYNLTSEYNIGGSKTESSSVLINNAAKMQRESQDELKKIDKVLKEFNL
jgi:D-beta-D-heptose 7-phosphate kinase/D-beta-D-heptose 1-phosphate adenosyltransferase